MRTSKGYVRSELGTGKFRWYLLPPGAVGGRYGSGCLYESRSFSVCSMISYHIPH